MWICRILLVIYTTSISNDARSHEHKTTKKITAFLVLVFLYHGIEMPTEIQERLVRDFQKIFFTFFTAGEPENSSIKFSGSSTYFLIFAHLLVDWWHECTEILHFYCMTFISDKNYAVQNWSASRNRTKKNSEVHEWEVVMGGIK
jgi:hypothetical protein